MSNGQWPASDSRDGVDAAAIPLQAALFRCWFLFIVLSVFFLSHAQGGKSYGGTRSSRGSGARLEVLWASQGLRVQVIKHEGRGEVDTESTLFSLRKSQIHDLPASAS